MGVGRRGRYRGQAGIGGWQGVSPTLCPPLGDRAGMGELLMSFRSADVSVNRPGSVCRCHAACGVKSPPFSTAWTGGM